MSTDYLPRLASKSPARIYPRYTPSYQGYQSKITLERVDDDAPGYAGYIGRTKDYSSYHPYFFRESKNDLSYPPFGYVSSFKNPDRTAQLEVFPTSRDSDLKAVGRAEAVITTTEAVAVKPFRSQRYRILGYFISILAILTFVFEIADVIVATLSDSKYCKTASGFLTIPWFFAWVVPGIWASIPIFVTGILAIYVMDNYGRVFKALAIICSVCAFFFAPAIIAVSAAEEAMFINYCPDVWGNITTTPPEPVKAKFVFPIILIILGILEMLLLLYLTIVLCQAYEGLTSEVIITEAKTPPTISGSDYPATVVVPTPTPVPVPVPVPVPPPPPAPAPAIPDVISIVVPRPPQTLPLPRVTGVGVPARVVYMEAHNHGYAYANTPGYFTTLPPTNATAMSLPATTDSGYKWF